jgi:hypothetical protein
MLNPRGLGSCDLDLNQDPFARTSTRIGPWNQDYAKIGTKTKNLKINLEHKFMFFW